MKQSILIFILLIFTSSSYAQFLTAESPQYFTCDLEEKSLKAEIKFEPQSQLMSVEITDGSVVLRKVRGVALLIEEDFSSINSEFAPFKTLELGAYTLTKGKGYSLTYPSLVGEWAGESVSVRCLVKE